MEIQNKIGSAQQLSFPLLSYCATGADIMMALDDVVHVLTSGPRVEEALHRTLRWIDRCIVAHKRPNEQVCHASRT